MADRSEGRRARPNAFGRMGAFGRSPYADGVPSQSGVLSRQLLPASIALYLTVALAAFEGTAFAAAIPQMAADLGSVSLLPWVITAFLLTSGVATIVTGRLIDSVGVRTMFRISIVLFAGAGTAAAFAPNMPVMIALRSVQGAGAGMVIAVGLAAVSLIYPPHLTGRAFAANSTVWGAMGVMAPAIAAFVLTTFDWRWILLVNLPLGMISLIVGWNVMPARSANSPKTSVDVMGVALAMVFTFSLLMAVDGRNLMSLVWATGAIAAGWLFYIRAGTAERPLVERRFLTGRPFGPLAVANTMIVGGAFAANAFLPVYVRAGRLGSDALAAWSVLFLTVGWTTGANTSSRLLDTRTPLRVVQYGFGATIPGLALTAFAAFSSAPLAFVFASLIPVGLGVGLATNASLTLIQSSASANEMGRATSAYQFFRNQGFAIGSALGGAVLLGVVTFSIGDLELMRAVLAGESSAGAVPQAIELGYGWSAAAGGVVAGLGLIPLRRLTRS